MSVLNIRDFPDDLHYRARVAAAEDDQSLRALVIEAVEEKLERREQARRQAKPRRTK